MTFGGGLVGELLHDVTERRELGRVCAGGRELGSEIHQRRSLRVDDRDDGLVEIGILPDLREDFIALRDQISTIVGNAQFNGYNLVDGSTTQVTALASTDGTRRITVAAENMSLSGSIVTVSTGASISTQSGASTMVAAIQTSLVNIDAALGKLSSGSKKFSIQVDFSQKLSDALTGGIGNLVDANMATESAQLQSLQIKQQLGVQALSIANQAPQTILSLFR